MDIKCFKITLSQAIRRSLLTTVSQVYRPGDLTYALSWTKWYSATVFLESIRAFLVIH